MLVDDARVIADLSAAATMAGGTLHVYVEIDVGAHRCGVAPGAAGGRARAGDRGARRGSAFAACTRITARAQHLRTPDERRAAIARRERAGRGNEGD